MDTIPLSALFITLFVLILLSAFFSGSETALMTLNRYRLRHRADSGDLTAQNIRRLLKQPDRLIGVILLGNNFVNILASSVATIIALRLWGEAGIAIATFALTLVVLIFAELTPKTLAATHPEKLAYPASWVLKLLLVLLRPFVFVINLIANNLLRLFGVDPNEDTNQRLNLDELRSVVNEADALTHGGHQTMLVNLLDLEAETVEDIMIPRNEIEGIDIEDDADQIARELRSCAYNWLAVYRGEPDQTFGMLHVRKALPLLHDENFDKDRLAESIQEPYFVPLGTPLIRQMLNFRTEKQRIGFVVDEYGDIKGLITLADILEEIVGEFTTDPGDAAQLITESDDGFLVDAAITLRALNRAFGWQLPLDGPKTLNGLVLEHMESLPSPGTGMRLAGKYPMEITQTTSTGVKTVRISSQVAQKPDQLALLD